jgi:segregation and condensation protein B
MDEEKKDYKGMIESLLFASGRFMTLETLIALTKASGKDVITKNVAKLKEEYEKRNSPLMIVEEKDGWKITVKEAYLPLVRKIVSETELPKTILETLAVIAWKSPVYQSEIVDIRHNKAYEHIEELEQLEFIKKEKKGRSFILKLTEKFYNYFDIEGAKDIRQVFNKVVNRVGQSKVDDFGKLPETPVSTVVPVSDPQQANTTATVQQPSKATETPAQVPKEPAKQQPPVQTPKESSNAPQQPKIGDSKVAVKDEKKEKKTEFSELDVNAPKVPPKPKQEEFNEL